MFDRLILTCEHGSNRVPARYAHLFVGSRRVLDSHRGYDIGALAVARRFAKTLNAPLHSGMVTRLLVDLNRSPGHRDQFSALVKDLDDGERASVVKRYYLPYRTAMEDDVRENIAAGRRVLHLAIHSFTPVLCGERRHADAGLLYDPSRRRERELCRRWKELIAEYDGDLRIRRNYPYTGLTDGFIPYLRRRYSATSYIGIEIEMNQKSLRRSRPRRNRYVDVCLASFTALVDSARSRC